MQFPKNTRSLGAADLPGCPLACFVRSSEIGLNGKLGFDSRRILQSSPSQRENTLSESLRGIPKIWINHYGFFATR
jgi:hypothetical protein